MLDSEKLTEDDVMTLARHHALYRTLAEMALEEAVALLNRWRFHDRKKCQADLCWETDAFVAKVAPPETHPEK